MGRTNGEAGTAAGAGILIDARLCPPATQQAETDGRNLALVTTAPAGDAFRLDAGVADPRDRHDTASRLVGRRGAERPEQPSS